MPRWILLAALLTLAVALAACDGDDPGIGALEAGSCAVADLPWHQPGVLTAATGEEPAAPWVAGDPADGQGFEPVLVHALAAHLGLHEQVRWVRTPAAEALTAGDKPYDFSIQRHLITADAPVDFSVGYYQAEPAVVVPAGSSLAAGRMADLAGLRLGAPVTAAARAEVTVAARYPDLPAAAAGLAAGEVDALVVDLPAAPQVPGGEVAAVLPRTGGEPELGLVFEAGSPLVPCMNAALQTLVNDGTVAAFAEHWLYRDGQVPRLSP